MPDFINFIDISSSNLEPLVKETHLKDLLLIYWINLSASLFRRGSPEPWIETASRPYWQASLIILVKNRA